MLQTQELIWWITVFELPAFASLFWLIWKNRQDAQDSYEYLTSLLEKRTAQHREALSAYKLEVAKTYAAHSDVKELENRVIGHLLRIEAKLDATALKTEALKAERPKDNSRP